MCSIIVHNDPVKVLQTRFNVTDTFHLMFENSHVVSISNSANDQPTYFEAKPWVETNMPKVINGPCDKDTDTLTDSVDTMTEGYKRFYVSINKED